MTYADDFNSVRALISEYPGYGEEDQRLQSDRLVRAWVGSCLSSTRERLAGELSPEATETLDSLIFRCQFPDQRYIAVIDHAELDDTIQGHLVSLDLRVLRLAQEACAVSATDLGRLMSEINATFDERIPVSA
jgi:hypothetical protein